MSQGPNARFRDTSSRRPFLLLGTPPHPLGRSVPGRRVSFLRPRGRGGAARRRMRRARPARVRRRSAGRVRCRARSSVERGRRRRAEADGCLGLLFCWFSKQMSVVKRPARHIIGRLRTRKKMYTRDSPRFLLRSSVRMASRVAMRRCRAAIRAFHDTPSYPRGSHVPHNRQVDDADDPPILQGAFDDVAREIPATAVFDDRLVGRRGAESKDAVVNAELQEMAKDRRPVVRRQRCESEGHAQSCPDTLFFAMHKIYLSSFS